MYGPPHNDRAPSLRPRNRRAIVVLVTLVSVVLGFFAVTVAPSSALCRTPPCSGDREGGYVPPPPPPPPPVVTTISGVSPGFGWAGDTIRLSGTGFTGTQVTFNGQAVALTSASSSSVTFVVPPTIAPLGPNTVPIVASSPTGTANASFTLSPTISNEQSISYDYSGPYANPCCPSAWGPDWSHGKVSLDRSSGFGVPELTVSNGQTWSSISVNISALLVDGNGTVIGFTPIHNVTAAGWITHPWSPVSVVTTSFSDAVSPTITSQTRSVQLVMVRDHFNELSSTLSTAVAVGQTVVQVAQFIAKFI